ncbi:MAG: peptide ABC transporter substrate-binding protein [Spirochaetales bacterium]|nr:peptide ABC transporter substrate-binding protein [Spirochaetales bacterium]
MKKILTIALMLIVAFAVFAQGASEGKKNAAEDNSSKTVTFAMASAWTTFNPYADVTSYACITNDLIWDKLAFITPSENLPRNAKEWSMSADGKTYTFKLDPNAKWTDGQPVTANDWVFAARLVTDPAYTAAPKKGSIFSKFVGTDEAGNELSENSVGWKAIDDYTLQMELKDPMDIKSFIVAYNSYIFALPEHVLKDIDPAKIAEDPFWEKPVTNGPLTIESEIAGNELVLKSNPNYHLGAPKFGTIILRVYTPEALAAGYMAGEIDACNNAMTMDDCETTIALSDKIEMIKQDYPCGYVALSFNHEVFPDAKVRKALSYCVDFDTLNEVIYKGTATITSCPWIPRGDYYTPEYCTTEYNLQKAKQMLEEAGFDFSKTYSLSTATGYRQTAAEIIQASLKEIGVKVDIQTGDSATVLGNQRTGKCDLGIWGDSSITDDPNTAAQRYVQYASSTFSYGLSPHYKELFDEFAKTLDPAKKKSIANEIQKFYQEDCPQILLFVFPKYSLKSKRLQNYNYDAMLLYNQDVWNWVVE